jgi:hypothetical protein
VRKALAGEHRQVPFFALLEEVAEARGTSGPINAKGGSSYSVALRGAGTRFVGEPAPLVAR